ncbi:FG-GAP repeat domain-containing protein [Leucobacter tenebrionis]|uniref:FG-GAP repeat domain-containing protein n=1 Tax=Leucobacter tenebrionis TaxID=2873270 RepID=UPI001CA738B8|nr:VCBS repeat-containing protein [Leucobacter tenebrionis]QZY53120.1 VCBS repeat-containing protein [Leucobacter tenebrionis]
MESLSYPMQADTGLAAKESWVYGGGRDKEEVYPSYTAARQASRDAHMNAASTWNAPQMSAWADCGGYVATVVKNMVDPHFPWLLTNRQRQYLEDPTNGWTKVGDTHDYRPSDYQPGDVMVGSGHIMFWVGDWQGRSEVVNDASLSFDETTRSGKMPGFRIAALTPGISKETGKPAMVDGVKRHYEVYRFTKRIASPIGTTDWANRSDDIFHDGRPDIIAVTSAGSLRFYPGTGAVDALGPYTQIGSGFVNHQVITPGDFDHDGYQDIISVNNGTGAMYLHRGNGTGGFLNRVQIGSGFQTIRELTSVGDFDGDSNPDLLGITRADGRLVLWRGNGAGGWLSQQEIGSGFQNLKIASAGDFDGNGRPDIVSWNDSTGLVYLHRGNGNAGWLSRITLAQSGFANRTFQSIGDIDRDGYGDLIAIDRNTGQLIQHSGGPTGTVLGAGTPIGSGWEYMRSIS